MKWCTYPLVLILMLSLASIPAAANVTPLSVLTDLEYLLYGDEQEGSLISRVAKMEQHIYGDEQSGAIMVRIDRMQQYLQSTISDQGSLMLRLNMAEWGFLAKINSSEPLLTRLTGMEMALLGEEQSGPIKERTESLMTMIWGTASLDVQPVQLREESLVRIRMLTSVDSGTNDVGDIVRYRVVDDVMVDGRIVIPAGLEAQGRVTEVVSAGRLGRDGRLVIDFGHLTTIDGQRVSIEISERATEKNTSLELAAGASMAGVLLLGPIGLVSGYFIRGRDVEIPATTEFYVETSRALRTSGLLLRPASY